MKNLIYLFLMLVSMTPFSQENPWTPKGENIWGAYEKQTENTSASPQVLNTLDTAAIVETSEQNLSEAEYDALVNKLNSQVLKKYKNEADFGVGFTIGIFLGIPGIVGDGIYAISDSKRENKIVDEVSTDSTYSAIPEKQLIKETKKTMKNKKFGKAVGGTMVAVLIRMTVFGAIILTSF